MRRPSYRSAAATSSTPFTRSAVWVSPNPIPPAPIKPILIRSFADTCRSDSGSGSRMNVFGEPLARANDPAAIAPAAAVLINFRREFFSASLSDLDLRITSPLFRYFLREAIRHKKHKKVYARREYSLGLRSPLPIRFVFFVFLCALFVAPQVSLSTQSAGDL